MKIVTLTLTFSKLACLVGAETNRITEDLNRQLSLFVSWVLFDSLTDYNITLSTYFTLIFILELEVMCSQFGVVNAEQDGSVVFGGFKDLEEEKMILIHADKLCRIFLSDGGENIVLFV